MRPGTRLAIISASIILFWGAVGYFVFRGDNPKKRAVEVAELALKASVDNPESVKIIGISGRIQCLAGSMSRWTRRCLSPWR